MATTLPHNWNANTYHDSKIVIWMHTPAVDLMVSKTIRRRVERQQLAARHPNRPKPRQSVPTRAEAMSKTYLNKTKQREVQREHKHERKKLSDKRRKDKLIKSKIIKEKNNIQ